LLILSFSHRELDITLFICTLHTHHGRREPELAGNVVEVQRDITGEKHLVAERPHVFNNVVDALEEIGADEGHETFLVNDQNLLYEVEPR